MRETTVVQQSPDSPDSPDPPSSAMPAAPSPILRPLTHTPGYGVANALGPVDGTIILTMGSEDGGNDQWRRLSLADGRSQPLGVPIPPHGVVHPGHDGRAWLVEARGISGISPDGRIERLFEREPVQLERVENHSWMSSDQRWLAIATAKGFELWDLTGSKAPVRIELGAKPRGLAWSPDHTRIIAVVSMSSRFDVFDVDGNLQTSTPWPEEAAGTPIGNPVWLPSGPVILTYRDSKAWVQCLEPAADGLTLGPRSGELESSPQSALVGMSDEHTLIATWTDVQGEVLVVERHDERAIERGRRYAVSRGLGSPVWRSEDELALLAEEPPGALMVADLQTQEAPTLVQRGPYGWASGDGEGGLVLGSADGTALEYQPAGATSPSIMPIAGMGALPYLRCHSPRECMMVSSSGSDVAFMGVDLEQQQVRRRFDCPLDLRWLDRWGLAHDGRALLLTSEDQRAVTRFDAATGERLGAPWIGPRWAQVQSATDTARGELLVTGVLVGEPPQGVPQSDTYALMQSEADGGVRVLWSNDRTWVVRPLVSPSGDRIALDGMTRHSELVSLELDLRCSDAPTPLSKTP